MAPGSQNTEPSWPPRSPHEALLSTPKGRQRYRDMLNQNSPTLSPTRQHTRALASVISQSEDMHDQEMEDDEDEETLQLKLQEIQARLKLKRLQKAKEKDATGSNRLNDDVFRSSSAASDNLPRRGARVKTPEAEEKPRPMSQSFIQVPASPVRKTEALLPPKSPSRVLLGIDKGLKAKDISLKRAPSFRRTAGDNDAMNQRGGFLERSRSLNSPMQSDSSRPKSFNERLFSARNEEASRAERQERIQKLRSNAFGIGKDEMEQFKKQAVDIPDEPLMTRSFTRDEIMGKPRSGSGSLTSSQTAPSFRSFSGMSNTSDSTNSNDQRGGGPMAIDSSGDQSTSFEPYSSFHLSKRILPHTVLARHVSGKKTLNIKDLLKVVKAPDFALPDIEQDIVVFAVVAKKSEPRAHKPTAAKNGQKQEDRGKYMVVSLVDLEYELDLFLFNTGFTRYWKLTEGTVVAILNPNVMPPPPGRQDTGRFSLVLNSDEDTIIEVGTARDLGFCQAMKKDGDLCNAWVNKKRTQFCEFHSNEAIRKQRSTRMEVNSHSFGSRERSKPQHTSKEPFEFGKKKPHNYDWETKTHWFVSKTHSASDLIDGRDRSASDRKEKAEFLKRNMESKERERDIMKKLGQIGNAAGREYMQRAGSRNSTGQPSGSNSSSQGLNSADTEEPVRPDIASLFLDRDREIHLSPVKRKRTGSSHAGSITGSSNGDNSRRPLGFGWGSGLRDKLANMKDGEKFKPEQPPLRKKTRFVTDKGIRIAGRESIGNLVERQVALEDDDDDELVIVK
ncbi:DNA replication licensing factor mcm10 [Cladobotryum mycophilum]|uniref:DNA replication licensing factor mcm10 n=1 Tax=Cladobotryum mycophilum TaxID=491253 RepID=A0ABR0S6N8_9HYPO